ncbi:MAG TPA: D-alanyl-D-alanine carboxypeptidase family protein [Candidatus Hydrogenedentes bacterium]|nr:D-alanyl-D-alanine carboxypeptidase family protein [Candidatus Hydrogenedentota bacterium]HPG70230.1 D-alanyl-D-alanine carboxypeptidase family protein [Candidatus Hydrogenedentota bacterium]
MRYSMFFVVFWALVSAVSVCARAGEPPVSAYCVDIDTDTVFCEENADIERPPASMVKMILMLLVAEGVDEGKWTLERTMIISKHSQEMGGTQIWLKEGSVQRLSFLMEAIAVASANDAAMAVAEGLWGSEDKYLEKANARMAELGMTHTKFNSVHGLPPRGNGKDPDKTTARDMAILAKACVAHPIILKWTSQTEFRCEPDGPIVAHNTNKLLTELDGCDGLKTGYIRDSMHCVTATVKRSGHRLVAVVMGGESSRARFDKAKQMIEDGFKKIAETPEPVPATSASGADSPPPESTEVSGA